MITIVDYGVGNLSSIANMIKKVGGSHEITGDPEKIRKAEKLILPGVGHFAKGMENLRNSGFIEILNHKALVEKVPVLGICLGMQLLTKHSEEGNTDGLGWIQAKTVRFNFGESKEKNKIPHMGWNEIIIKSSTPLLKGFHEAPRFYFVHSFHVKVENPENIICTAHHGYEFVCGIQSDNVMGVQFHPEKSHKFGMQLIRNFIEIK